MVLALIILFISCIFLFCLIWEWSDFWFIPAFFAIASFTFLVTVTYTAQDCEDFGKFKSVNHIYQCQLIKGKTDAKNEQ